ncbi:hypothetical protein AVEN_255315-1, partial [Araneus ventricosus]
SDFFLPAPFKPGVLGRKRHELDSPNLGGHFPHNPAQYHEDITNGNWKYSLLLRSKDIVRFLCDVSAILNAAQYREDIMNGNECLDQLAKEAITKGDPFFLPKPLSYLKSGIRSAALSFWQDDWDIGETGRSTHDIVPRVSNKPVGWNREDIMFATGHGPFPSYLHRFNVRAQDNCSCGEKGDPMHYATKCQFTMSWHFQTPTVSLKLQ